ncbi:MAG: gamma-glutamyl-gamma-aminobutyrate hydrolase family protein [Bacteroidaceae bacterium]|nr:gamma-glutamyl-gamma-aminobutyrate hydrolase family protein [Bacteroides sp.]MBO5079873.1 gamma-glutamyl-gamma-aminobutyrate hydrolase family protein [Bacteroidaceae bacterium]MBQ4589222.1 gamma-glutamyl-gamma-aminobutyrate hydrolase family protein [Bacteroidaceae bacterium]
MKRRYLLLALLAMGTLGSVQAQRKRVSPYAPKLEQLYTQADDAQRPAVGEKPLIGISLGYSDKKNSVNNTYINSILKNGGVPYLIPVTDDVEVLRQIVAQLDGIVFTGGEDFAPAYYGKEEHEKLGEVNVTRDTYDLTLLKLATDRNIPTLGICRGLQLINVGMGGTLYQDLPAEKPSDINHRQEEEGTVPTHSVSVVEGSVMHNIFGKQEIQVNTFHHQAIDKLAPGLKIVGWSNDSVPELIEAYPHRQILGTQFHPEIFTAAGDALMGKLFKFLVNKADTFKMAKDIHTRILSVDTHTDTPLWFTRGNFSVGMRKSNQVSIQKMEEGKLDAQFLAAFLAQKELDEASSQKAVEKCHKMIEGIYADVAKYKDECGIALTEEDARRLKAEGKKAFFIGIENGYAIGKDIKNVKKYKDMGVQYMTLSHSYDNDICNSSSNTADASKGLTAFGRKVVKEMNKVGMMIDVSHVSEGTFWDVIKLSKDPIFASHSSVRALCDHDRNLTDEQLRALAKNGGVIQICIYGGYLNKDAKTASVDDVVRHIDHAVKVAGIDHVGIGSDFDGGGGVLGCAGDNDMINITVKLIEKGYSEEDLRKIWGGNFFRVMNQVINK